MDRNKVIQKERIFGIHIENLNLSNLSKYPHKKQNQQGTLPGIT